MLETALNLNDQRKCEQSSICLVDIKIGRIF